MDPFGLSRIIARVSWYAQATGEPNLPPPCNSIDDLLLQCKESLNTDIPADYLELLRECDGMAIGDIEYFGSTKRIYQVDRGNGEFDKIVVPAIVEYNLLMRKDVGLANYLFIGECESGLLAFDPMRCRYVTLDHLLQPGEELDSIEGFLRFTIGRIVPLN